MRLREGPLLLCSFTDQRRDWKTRKGMTFKAADGSDFTGYGMFAALSFDDGRSWPVRAQRAIVAKPTAGWWR